MTWIAAGDIVVDIAGPFGQHPLWVLAPMDAKGVDNQLEKSMASKQHDIRWVATHTDDGTRIAIIVVDEETEIFVNNLGSSDFTIRLRNVALRDNPDYDPEAGIVGFKPGAEFWGTALVWAEPRTIARLVMDVINNQ